MFKTSPTITEISKALLSIQNEFLAIKKEVKGQRNNYADYPQLITKAKPALTKAGIILLQPVTHDLSPDSHYVTTITTILIHAASGEFFQSTSLVNEMDDIQTKDGKSVINRLQREGGGISYMKRYALVAMLSWATGEYDLDQGMIEEQDKKTQFIMDSFQDLLKESAVNDDFAKHIITGVTSISDIQGKKQVYAQLKNVILPKAKEDIQAAAKMFNDAIREAA
ncbi:ERF family protein [bacterium]|nr:ERF family protein [bacterium]